MRACPNLVLVLVFAKITLLYLLYKLRVATNKIYMNFSIRFLKKYVCYYWSVDNSIIDNAYTTA